MWSWGLEMIKYDENHTFCTISKIRFFVHAFRVCKNSESHKQAKASLYHSQPAFSIRSRFPSPFLCSTSSTFCKFIWKFQFKILILHAKTFSKASQLWYGLPLFFLYFGDVAKAFPSKQIWSIKFEIDSLGLVQTRRGRKNSSCKDLRETNGRACLRKRKQSSDSASTRQRKRGRGKGARGEEEATGEQRGAPRHVVGVQKPLPIWNWRYQNSGFHQNLLKLWGCEEQEFRTKFLIWWTTGGWHKQTHQLACLGHPEFLQTLKSQRENKYSSFQTLYDFLQIWSYFLQMWAQLHISTQRRTLLVGDGGTTREKWFLLLIAFMKRS